MRRIGEVPFRVGDGGSRADGSALPWQGLRRLGADLVLEASAAEAVALLEGRLLHMMTYDSLMYRTLT